MVDIKLNLKKNPVAIISTGHGADFELGVIDIIDIWDIYIQIDGVKGVD